METATDLTGMQPAAKAYSAISSAEPLASST